MKIYGTFLTGHLSRFKEDVQARAPARGGGRVGRGRAGACSLGPAAAGQSGGNHLRTPRPWPPQELGTKVLQAALALHERASSTFRKTAVNFHYEFTVGRAHVCSFAGALDTMCLCAEGRGDAPPLGPKARRCARAAPLHAHAAAA